MKETKENILQTLIHFFMQKSYKVVYTAELIHYKKTEIDLLKSSGRLEELITKNLK
jgi:hypothetical protein